MQPGLVNRFRLLISSIEERNSPKKSCKRVCSDNIADPVAKKTKISEDIHECLDLDIDEEETCIDEEDEDGEDEDEDYDEFMKEFVNLQNVDIEELKSLIKIEESE